MMYSKWQEHRMVITWQGVGFKLMEEDNVRDYVPLDEIECIAPQQNEVDDDSAAQTTTMS